MLSKKLSDLDVVLGLKSCLQRVAYTGAGGRGGGCGGSGGGLLVLANR